MEIPLFILLSFFFFVSFFLFFLFISFSSFLLHFFFSFPTVGKPPRTNFFYFFSSLFALLNLKGSPFLLFSFCSFSFLLLFFPLCQFVLATRQQAFQLFISLLTLPLFEASFSIQTPIISASTTHSLVSKLLFQASNQIYHVIIITSSIIVIAPTTITLHVMRTTAFASTLRLISIRLRSENRCHDDGSQIMAGEDKNQNEFFFFGLDLMLYFLFPSEYYHALPLLLIYRMYRLVDNGEYSGALGEQPMLGINCGELGYNRVHTRTEKIAGTISWTDRGE